MPSAGPATAVGTAEAATRPTTGPTTEDEALGFFQQLDKDNSGSLEVPELQEGLQHLGLPSTRAYVEALLTQYDRNHDGSVDWPEFKRYILQQERAITAAFRSIDVDGNGRVSARELVQVMSDMGTPMTGADADRMIQLLDQDGNNEITFDEFRRFACLLPRSQLSRDGIMYTWIDSADWMEGIEYRLCMTPPSQPLQRLLAGGVAGAISRTTVAPLERLRTMMMADARNKSISGTLRRMWADGGLRGLWKGNMASVVKVVPQCAIQMTTYDTVKDIMLATSSGGSSRAATRGDLSSAQKLAAGCAAGAASVLVTYPLEMLRTQMSMDRPNKGYFATASQIVKTQGFRGLYGGFRPCLLNTMAGNGLGFAAYETGVQMYRNAHDGQSPTAGQRGGIAGGAAICVMGATMPLEVVMRRLQIQGTPGYPVRYRGMADAFATMAREEGLISFYRGSLSSFMKVAPSIGVVRFLYEVMVSSFGIGGIRRYRDAAV